MLGFVGNIMLDYWIQPVNNESARFVSTAAVAIRLPDADLRLCRALDARHGRVLLECRGDSGSFLMVWDPITDGKRQVPTPPLQRYMVRWNAAVLCAGCGRCDHLDCHRGPFLVVYMGYACVELGYASRELVVCTYSSDATQFPQSSPLNLSISCPALLVGNALYFGCMASKTLLKYDLESNEISVDPLPFTYRIWRHVVLDNEPGLATVHESKPRF